MVESEELLKTLEEIESEALKLIREANSVEEIEAVRLRYLAKRSHLQQVLRSIGKLPVEMRPKVGELANRVREAIQSAFEEKRKELEAVERDRRLASEKIDVTMPGRIWRIGSLHPITQTINEICSIFTDLGFEVVDGPEIETEWHNFVALNMPQDHPARDDHDSFYITDGILLRTETSAVQIRVMESRQPPIRIVSPGRVYRRDEVDRTHSHTFHQVEGLLVDEDVTFADLKGTLIVFAKRFFGEDVKVRFRPHYFPFTEPSAEVDVSCPICEARGCPVCKQRGWVEVLGCGMVHPNVLRNVGYDTERWQGYAFGMGVERLAMLRHKIDDIRLFYENDMRFLRQFV
ncbi:MAG: hypothetical protein HZRFUVUK_000911 [Candidatus Fervidibacterota bacterium]|jgi:phenylalanyl-tRNA synthetase alpha chain